jgi:hypothetical protein
MNVYLRHAYAAILCNGMLPPSAISKVCAKSHPRRRRAVELGRCPVRTWGSKVRFADQPGTTQVETRIGENAPTQIESGMGLTVCEVHPNS